MQKKPWLLLYIILYLFAYMFMQLHHGLRLASRLNLSIEAELASRPGAKEHYLAYS